ncbi:MAG: hypothetical protein EOP84_28250 [Verrucomicrobiaceae bacterium]|nr:MAG: hypothetical protein EOP84_28250 [Verrucomicrobiaceae bacterium]
MMTDNYPQGHRALSTVRGYLDRLAERLNDKRVHRLDFETQKMEDGIGAAWHPNLTTNRKMADRLVEALKRDLRW